MAAGRCLWEEMPDRDGLGGRGLAAAILTRETPPECAPLGPRNKLIFSPGLLGATACLPHNRLAVGCKSPVTGRLKSALAEGAAANLLMRLGILGVIIERQAPPGQWLQLEIRHGQARLAPSPVAGLGNFAALSALEQLYGSDCARITIGPAGEMRLPLANIAFGAAGGIRHAGQDGLGAVMGAMGLKSVVLFPEGDNREYRPADPKVFRKAGDRLAAALAELAAKARQGRADAGAEAAAPVPAGENTRPRDNNCSQVCGLCGPLFTARRKQHRKKSAAYNALWRMLKDEAARARFDYLCNDLGLDAFALGAAAHAARERDDPARDAAALVRALENLGRGEAPRALPDAEPFAPASERMTFAALLSAFTADNAAPGERERPFPCLPSEDSQRKNPESGQAAFDGARAATAFADAMGLCAFAARAVLKNRAARTAVTDMVAARFGWRLPENYALALGPRILEMEEAFDRRAGALL